MNMKQGVRIRKAWQEIRQGSDPRWLIDFDSADLAGLVQPIDSKPTGYQSNVIIFLKKQLHLK